MWYVAQVFTGEEEKTKDLCEKQVSSQVLERCFIPYYEEMKRYQGKWHKEKRILFPGYVFMITGQVEELYKELKKVGRFTRLLGDEECLIPLSQSEVSFLGRFGGEEQVVGMSIGVIENDQVRITEGPLMGLEGCIRKIDRHKRQAKIQVEMFGRIVEAVVGVEIVRKV